jgi:hypothetical protein
MIRLAHRDRHRTRCRADYFGVLGDDDVPGVLLLVVSLDDDEPVPLEGEDDGGVELGIDDDDEDVDGGVDDEGVGELSLLLHALNARAATAMGRMIRFMRPPVGLNPQHFSSRMDATTFLL